MPRAGKKILATGGGRCNLANTNISPSHFNDRAAELVSSCLQSHGLPSIISFFQSLGVYTYDEEGKLYPVTRQAATILTALEIGCEMHGVQMLLGSAVNRISKTNKMFVIETDDKVIHSRKLIMCTGGRTYPALGSDGSGYPLVKMLGHNVLPAIPCCVPLVCKDALCHPCQGLKLTARVSVDGYPSASVVGDLLITKYGLSGTTILDISDVVSEQLNREHKTSCGLHVDFAPFITDDQLQTELNRRRQWPASPAQMLNGILPSKLSAALEAVIGKQGYINAIKHYSFNITDTRGWNEAEFTNGGVPCCEVNSDDLSSTCCHGLYLAGELLDVHGQRGGYNLAWAWISGMITGNNAAKSSKITS